MKAFTKTVRLLSVLLAVIMAAAVFASCKLTEDEPAATDEPAVSAAPVDLEGVDGKTVIMSSKHVDMTMYDFGQEFYSNRYYQYFLYGAMTADQYCDTIIEEVSNFVAILNAAEEAGVTLTEDEKEEINVQMEGQIEQVLVRYEQDVAEDVEDKRAEAKRLIDEDLAADGLDYDTFVELAKLSMCRYALADKYYQQLLSEVEIDESDVLAYINDQKVQEASSAMTDFTDKLNAYLEGQGPSPVVVPDDCFSVNHIFLKYETTTDEQGHMDYVTTSRTDDEKKLEELFAGVAGYEEFMKLEEEYGEDPGMDNENIREYGYVIHPDLLDSYYPGFVYAAMNLREKGWKPEIDLENGQNTDLPELEMFTLADGTEVVKVRTEPGVHYIIINKEYDKGVIPYEKGDARWESWLSTLRQNKFQEDFEALNNSWKELYPIEIRTDLIKAKFAVEPGA